MSLIDSPLLTTLHRGLDLTAQRQALVSQNIANIDTPGYRAKDIDFRAEMRRALLSADPGGSAPVVQEVPALTERPDGNNVSIDRESLLMAQNQLLFQVQVQILRSEFSRLQLAINGGSSQ